MLMRISFAEKIRFRGKKKTISLDKAEARIFYSGIESSEKDSTGYRRSQFSKRPGGIPNSFVADFYEGIMVAFPRWTDEPDRAGC